MKDDFTNGCDVKADVPDDQKGRHYDVFEEAAQDGRHGHPAKLRGEVRQWLEETCRQAPHIPSHEVQSQLAERFSLTVSVSQINRMRATLGVSNPPQSAKKK